MSAEITITDDLLPLSAFRLEKGEASLSARKTATLDLISEFGANRYIEEEVRSMSETVNSFNERPGTAFSCEDFLRFGRVTRDIMDDEMTKMVRNSPADIVIMCSLWHSSKGWLRCSRMTMRC